MAGEKTYLLRLPPEMYAALERWAREERRSVNSQIVHLLDHALRDAGRAPEGQHHAD
jgi:hypothetical protein